MMVSLGQSVESYYGGIMYVDELIAKGGGTGGYTTLARDLIHKADMYKDLFDTAAASGSAQAVWDIGQQYARTISEMNTKLGIGDFDELKRIAEVMKSTASPEDFRASVEQTLRDFKDGVTQSINNITTALNNIHPDIKLNVNVDIPTMDPEETTATVGIMHAMEGPGLRQHR